MFSFFFIGQTIKSMQGGKIQVLLDSGSVALLTFKDGKFSSINNVKSTKPNYFLHASQCVNNQEMIVLEQKCLGKDCLMSKSEQNQVLSTSYKIDRMFLKFWTCPRKDCQVSKMS